MTKYCQYCRKAGHTDDECHCTRVADWAQPKFTAQVTLTLRDSAGKPFSVPVQEIIDALQRLQKS